MQLKELASQVDTGAQDKQMQLTMLGSSDAVFQDRNRELAVTEGELAKAEAQLSADKFHMLQVESAVARHRTESSGLEVDARTSQHKFDQLSTDLAQLRAAVEAAVQALTEVRARVEQARADQSRTTNEAQAAQAALHGATQNFREAQRKLQDIDRSIAQKTARLKLLQQLQEKWEGFGEGAKALLTGRLAGLMGEQKFTPITQGLEMRPEYAKALEALLGASVEAISVSDLATAQKILAQLETDKLGSVCLQVPAMVGARRRGRGCPPGLRSGDRGGRQSRRRTRRRAYCPPATSPTISASSSISGRRTRRSASCRSRRRKGDLVDRRGLIFGGHSKKPANSIVQREVDLRETGKAVVAEQIAHDEQRVLIDQLNIALNDAEAALEQKRKDVLATSQVAAAIHTEEKNAQKSHDDAATRLARMENELANLKREHDEALIRLAKAQALLTEAEAGVNAQKLVISTTEAAIAEKPAPIATRRRKSLAQARLELAERRQKVEVLDRGLGEMERRRGQLDELLIQRQIELETWSEQVGAAGDGSSDQKRRAAQIGDDAGRRAGERRKDSRRAVDRGAGDFRRGAGAHVHPRRGRVLAGRFDEA